MAENAAHRFSNDLRYRDEAHPQQTQLTPGYVLEPVRESLGGSIGLDPCTLPENPTAAEAIYHPPQDGAALPWDAESIYVNPPYGKARERWVERCMEAGMFGRRVVLLIPAAMDTRIVQRALASADAVVFIRGRVKFGVLRPNRRQQAASHPSMLLGWNADLESCGHLGHRVDLNGVLADAAADRSIPIPDEAVRAMRRVRRGQHVNSTDGFNRQLLGQAVPHLYEAWLNDLADDAEALFDEAIAECSAVRLLSGDLAVALRKRAAALGLSDTGEGS